MPRSALCFVLSLLCAPAVAAAQHGDGAAAATRATPQSRPQLLIVPTVTRGVDPVVARFVDRQLAQTATALGHAPLAAELAHASLAGASSPPTMRDLWSAMHRAAADRAVLAIVWAEGGEYRLQLRLASRDGKGPFYASGGADAAGLEATAEGLLGEVLGRSRGGAGTGAATETASETATGTGTGTGTETGAETGAETATGTETAGETGTGTGTGTASETGGGHTDGTGGGLRIHELQRDRAPQFQETGSRWLRLAVRTDSAFGLGDHRFFNQLLGVRALYRLDDHTAIGGYLGYVNLRTSGGRGASLLPAFAFEHRVDVGETDWAVPLRLMLGRLLANGAVLRVSSGVARALDEHTALSVDLLSPTFWVTPDRILFSLDLGVELSADF